LSNGQAHPRGTWTLEDDHLALHLEILGPIPAELLQRGIKTREYFDETDNDEFLSYLLP
jgi:serine/threonine-protein kinase SRPK3